jgi:integrase
MSVELRRRSDGRPCWNVRWREGGRNRGRIFDTRKDALAWDAEVRRRRRLGELGMLDHSRRTLSELHAEWWEIHASDISQATRVSYEYAWRRLIEPRLGLMRLSELTPLRIEQFMRALLRDGVGEASAEKAWVVLSSMFSRAEAWGWVARNPVRAARKPRKKNARRVSRALSIAEVEAIRAAMEQPDATLVSVLAYAGLRPGEALALRWGDIKGDRIRIARALSFGEEKSTTGRSRSVPMLPALRWDLATWRLASGRPSNDAYVFPGPDSLAWDEGRYRRWRRFTFKPAVLAAGLDRDIRVYDLRHHRASVLIQSGANIVEAARQLGHSPTVLLDSYAHVIDGVSSAAVDVEAEIVEAQKRDPRSQREQRADDAVREAMDSATV